MRNLQRITILIFGLVLIAFAGTKLHAALMEDHTPPVISCDSEVLELSVSEGGEALLRGVSASDDRDGDLTSQVIVKGLSQLIGADTARVSYIVFDSSDNMATAQRTVRYTDYEKPRFSLSHPLIYETGSQIKLLTKLQASDLIDGDLTDSIRVTKQNVNSSVPGVYSITFQVTNSMGDTESIPAKVIVRDKVPSRSPVLLSAYVAYVEQGSSFDPAEYIIIPEDGSGVEIQSNVDTGIPGAYEVSYTKDDFTVYLTVVVR